MSKLHNPWDWRSFGKWVRENRVKSIAYVLVVWVGSFYWAWRVEGTNRGLIIAALFISATIPLALLYYRRSIKEKDSGHRGSKVLAAVLAFMMLDAGPAGAQPTITVQSANGTQTIQAGLGCAVVALVGGGVMTVLLIRYCQKKFPKNPPPPTNAPPQEFVSLLAGSGGGSSSAANTFSSCGSCFGDELSSFEPVPTMIELFVRYTETEHGPAFRIDTGSIVTKTEEMRDSQGFVRDLAEWGLMWTGTPGEIVYGKDGAPAEAWEVPIAFGEDNFPVLTTATKTRQVVIERSYDLVHWYTMIPLRVPVDHALRIVDATSSSAQFYRVRLVE